MTEAKNKENQPALHIQRICILLFSCLGIASIFMPWSDYILHKVNGARLSNLPVAAFFGVSALLAFTGKHSKKLPVVSWCILVALMLIAVVTGAMNYQQQLKRIYEFRVGKGVYFCLLAGAGILVSMAFGMYKKEKQPVFDEKDFAFFVLNKSGKTNLLEDILARCRKENITVQQHFLEGLEKRYNYSPTEAEQKVEEWLLEYKDK